MNRLIIYILIFLVSVFISSVSQVILKKSASRTYDSKIKEYLNLPVIFAYFLFFSCTLITVFSYKKLPLALGPILESFGYIFVSILGYFVLNEKFSRRKLLGMLLIIIGVIVFSLKL